MTNYHADWRCVWKKNGINGNETIDKQITNEIRYSAMDIFFS
ncbi:unnamed protein product [Nezara viridula]|uniref:Uncharacterized protein n=1 Tax=Nezara viridula TaxID=85310 RepID=A0A9P0MW43_NEZVI|nr:unnamed protein product [Nezara viridula]